MIANKIGLCVAAGMTAALASGPAMAADLSTKQPVYKAPAPVETSSPWQIRLRALGVVTDNSGHVNGVDGSLATSDTVVPELDISYYFTSNLAAELILGTTRNHVTGASGDLAGADVGKAWLLPPTLTFQYHFTQFGAFQPYVGAGVNYTFFFDQTAGSAVTSSHLHDTWGGALQVGFDYMIDKHWGVNFDVKKLYLRPEWDGNGGALTGKVNLDPWLIGGGVTYRF